jgi:hypothetical protein
MTRRRCVVACCLLVAPMSMFAASSVAQSRGAKADPLTGTWTGELVRQDDSRRIPVEMVLKFDGKNVVSGTVSGLPNPADVKPGSTFDQKTGALKLQLGKAGESAVLLVLEGTVVKGTATGRVSGDGGPGDFKIAKKA